MNLHTIITQHLKVYGFDGLYAKGLCACTVDELAPCGGPNIMECKPGFKAMVSAGHPYGTCDGELVFGPKNLLRIQADKPEQGGDL